MTGGWSWIGACSTGVSHRRLDRGCDDVAGCLTIDGVDGPVLIAVVSDGAGSAALSRVGAGIVVRSLCRSALSFVRSGGCPEDLSPDRVNEWLDDVRDRIDVAAANAGNTRRDFAATSLACLAGATSACVIHVGDGACALRLHDAAEWIVPSWPAQGEYAATTYFVTDDPTPRVAVTAVEGRIEALALLTDGLERLALDFGSGTAFAPFFNSMFGSFGTSAPGRQRQLSRDLRSFLDTPAVNERTDDDKTLILARRV